MRLFILTVASLGLVPTVLFAQHSSTTSSSSSSSSSSSASPSSSTTHTSPAPSISSGSSSSSSSFSSHSSAPSISTPISTPSVSSSHANSTPSGSGPGMHGGGSTSSAVESRTSDSAARLKETHITETKDSALGTHAESIKDVREPGRGRRTDIDANLETPSDTIPGVRVIKQPNGDPSGRAAASEHPPGGANLRHLPCDKEPCRNPEPKPEPKPGGGARIAICEVGPCLVCPPGHYSGKNAVCAPNLVPPAPLPRPTDNDDNYLYPVQQPWLTGIDALENCSLFSAEGAPLVMELRMLKIEILDRCAQGIEPDCSDAQMRQQARLLEYWGLLTRTPFQCQALLPSYISLM